MLLNKFDRIKGTTTIDSLKDVSFRYFDVQQSADADNTNYTYYRTYRLKKNVIEKIIGLNDFSIKVDRSIISFDITGKFKPDMYSELISKNSIYQYIDHLNFFQVVDVDPDCFIQNATISLVHSTKDIKVEKDAVEYLNFLKHVYSLNSKKVQVDKYKSGIVISKRTVSNPQRLSCYSKYEELKRNKLYNKQLIEMSSLDILGSFRRILRFELEINGKQNILKSFGISDNKLTSILNAESVPVVNVYNTLVNEVGEVV